MTNMEKFKEVFGFEPAKDLCLFNTTYCIDCKYFDYDRSSMKCVSLFWFDEYKEDTDGSNN